MRETIYIFLCLIVAINCFSMEEKREIFATNIQNYIQTGISLPSNSENLISRTKTDVTILFQGAKISEIPNLKRKYGFTDDMASQIQAAKYASGSNIYSKLAESVTLSLGVINESIGAAFRDGDMVYFAIIRGQTSGTLRTKYEKVCHEECDTILIFFEDCDTICNDISIPYTSSETQIITNYLKYYSLQALLSHVEILKQSGYQAYITDGNAIYSDDGNYLVYVTDFGDLAVGPSKDVDVVSPVETIELIDDGTRVRTGRGFAGRRLQETRTGRSRSTSETRTSSRTERISVTSSGRSSATRTGGRSDFSGEGTIVTRGVSRGKKYSKTHCWVDGIGQDIEYSTSSFSARRISTERSSSSRASTSSSSRSSSSNTRTTTRQCVDYYDGNFQLFNFIGNGVSGILSKEQVLKRMLDGRKNSDYHLLILNDGNLVLRSGETILWQSSTANKGVGPFDLKVTDDRCLILEDSTGKLLYKSSKIEEYNILKRIYCNDKHDALITVVSVSCKEEIKWKTLLKQEDNTKEIFRCMVNSRAGEYMVSLDSNCEGTNNVGSLGWIFNTQVSGTVPIYRCLADSDHFISQSSGCEGQKYEFLLGYAYPA